MSFYDRISSPIVTQALAKCTCPCYKGWESPTVILILAPEEKGRKCSMQMCLAIIKNMPEEKLKAAEEMLMKMATADGSIDPREKQLLELYSL